jgi:signal transduction histidine kinase
MDPLRRLRLRLTAWYAGTLAAILLVLGVGLFAAIVRQIDREAARMGTIVDDLLTLARADAGGRAVRRERCFLDDVVLDAVHAAQPLAERRGVRLEVGTLEEAAVLGEPGLLRQAALIVLDNALKYTPAGGTVTVGVSHAGQRCTLTVRDTGAGIAPEFLPHVFERFARGAPAEGREPGAITLYVVPTLLVAIRGRDYRLERSAS